MSVTRAASIDSVVQATSPSAVNSADSWRARILGLIRTSRQSRALNSSAWVVIGNVGSVGLRFLSSIVLTRLIAPDVTGIMAMVSVFLIGLEMFSDVGIMPSIIQNKRGDDRAFLNTAWTIQVLRGFALWIASCIGAWPVAQFFNEPILLTLIPIVGFSSVIAGFNSTSLAWLNRHLQMKRITILGLIDQVIISAIIIAWAWFHPTVWALVVGTMAGSLFYMVGTHMLVRGERDWFAWDRDSVRSLFRFGRWIFLSTVLAFFAMQMDVILCGRMFGAETLGVLKYALPLAYIARQFIKQIGAHVAFPVLSEVSRDRPEEFKHTLWRVRASLVGIGTISLLPLVLLGEQFIHIVYDPRWWDAGWMVQFLAAGSVAGLLNITYGNALLAMGKPNLLTVLLAFQLVFLVSGAIVGTHYGGEKGFIIGLAAVEWLNYPVTCVLMARRGLWQPWIDLPALAVTAVAVLVIW